MRRTVAWFSLIIVVGAFSAGCGNDGGGNAAEDNAFQKQLADAAAKNKGPAQAPRKSRGKISPDEAEKMKAGKTDGASTPGAAPGP